MEDILTTQQTLRPADELQYIRKIIADSRTAFVEDGMPYIWWGLIVAIGMGVSYFSALTQRDLHDGYIWLGLVLFGWGTIIYYVVQKKKRVARARSFVDRIQGAIWGACGGSIGLVVAIMICFQHSADAPQINSLYAFFVSSIILGIAYFLSGIANDLAWLRNVGFAWWAGAVAMYLWPSIHVIALYAGMLIVFQVVPGLILQRRYKRIISQPAEA